MRELYVDFAVAYFFIFPNWAHHTVDTGSGNLNIFDLNAKMALNMRADGAAGGMIARFEWMKGDPWQVIPNMFKIP